MVQRELVEPISENSTPGNARVNQTELTKNADREVEREGPQHQDWMLELTENTKLGETELGTCREEDMKLVRSHNIKHTPLISATEVDSSRLQNKNI